MARIIVKRPNENIEVLDIPSADVWARIRKMVCGNGGVMDRVHLADPAYSLTMYADDEGHAKELPFNFKLHTSSLFYPIQPIVGTVCFARGRIIEEEIEYTDITEQDISVIENILKGAVI